MLIEYKDKKGSPRIILTPEAKHRWFFKKVLIISKYIFRITILFIDQYCRGNQNPNGAGSKYEYCHVCQILFPIGLQKYIFQKAYSYKRLKIRPEIISLKLFNNMKVSKEN